MIIDVSGSMSVGNRLSSAQSAAKAVIETFSNNDFVGVIKFSTTAQALSSSRIMRATGEYKESLQ